MSYPSYYIAIDLVILRAVDLIEENSKKQPDKKIEFLAVKRALEPFLGQWSIPGGFLKPEEDLEQTAKRVLKNKLNISNVYMEQLFSFSHPKRDSSRDKRVITVSYLVLINEDDNVELKLGHNVKEFSWIDTKDLDSYSLAFDHNEIVHYAMDRLKNKVEYTDISLHLMPNLFTMASYRKAVEAIEQREIFRMEFKRNFEKYLEPTELLNNTGVGHKAARLMKKR